MTTKTTIKTKKIHWPNVMLNATYACVILAIILVATQFWLYGVRYQRIFADGNTWQAITLTNGQTYFGKLEQYGPRTLVLFNVYYLQASQTTDTSTSDLETDAVTVDGETESTTEPDSGLRLYKLTDDFHQPNDYLIINKDEVLYWQHLSDESPIVKTIAENS